MEQPVGWLHELFASAYGRVFRRRPKYVIVRVHHSLETDILAYLSSVMLCHVSSCYRFFPVFVNNSNRPTHMAFIPWSHDVLHVISYSPSSIIHHLPSLLLASIFFPPQVHALSFAMVDYVCFTLFRITIPTVHLRATNPASSIISIIISIITSIIIYIIIIVSSAFLYYSILINLVILIFRLRKLIKGKTFRRN